MWVGQGPHLVRNSAQTSILEYKAGRSPGDPGPPRGAPKTTWKGTGTTQKGTPKHPEEQGDPGHPERDLEPSGEHPELSRGERGTQEQAKSTSHLKVLSLWVEAGSQSPAPAPICPHHTHAQDNFFIPGPSWQHLAWLGVHGTFKWEQGGVPENTARDLHWAWTKTAGPRGGQAGQRPVLLHAPGRLSPTPSHSPDAGTSMDKTPGPPGGQLASAWWPSNQDPEGPPCGSPGSPGKGLTLAPSGPGQRHAPRSPI